MKLRKAILTFFLILLFANSSVIALANGNGPIGDRNPIAKATARITYAVGQDGDLLYNVLYNNVSGRRFSIAVLDEYGNQLYQAIFTDKNFDRKFKLADPESAGRLTFVIHSFADDSVQRFQVDATNRLEEEVQVKEIR